MPSLTAPDGARLHYTDEGSGQPILALSGLSRNGTDFDYVAPHLADARLIRLDYRGRGRSDWTGPDTYTFPTEAGDIFALLDLLNLDQVAILGTSRGGIHALGIAMHAKPRLTGVCLVDIGPELNPVGLGTIFDYIGRNPKEKTYEEAKAARAALIDGFEGVPDERWHAEVRKHYVKTEDGLAINYDPALRDALIANSALPQPDLWEYFDACAGLPLALIRGANSDILASETAAEMQRRRPDMIFADVPGRGHVPFLDEPEAIDAIAAWRALLP